MCLSPGLSGLVSLAAPPWAFLPCLWAGKPPDSVGGSGGEAFGGQTQGDQLILVCPGLPRF